jgi:hypothetical protein
MICDDFMSLSEAEKWIKKIRYQCFNSFLAITSPSGVASQKTA